MQIEKNKHTIILNIFAEDDEEVGNVKVNLKSIDKDALQAIKEYFTSNKKAFKEELKCSGINPLLQPLRYFKYELREPEHADVLKQVNKAGKMTLEIFNKWKKQNEAE